MYIEPLFQILILWQQSVLQTNMDVRIGKLAKSNDDDVGDDDYPDEGVVDDDDDNDNNDDADDDDNDDDDDDDCRNAAREFAAVGRATTHAELTHLLSKLPTMMMMPILAMNFLLW